MVTSEYVGGVRRLPAQQAGRLEPVDRLPEQVLIQDVPELGPLLQQPEAAGFRAFQLDEQASRIVGVLGESGEGGPRLLAGQELILEREVRV